MKKVPLKIIYPVMQFTLIRHVNIQKFCRLKFPFVNENEEYFPRDAHSKFRFSVVSLHGAILISLINVESTLTEFEKFHSPQKKATLHKIVFS